MTVMGILASISVAIGWAGIIVLCAKDQIGLSTVEGWYFFVNNVAGIVFVVGFWLAYCKKSNCGRMTMFYTILVMIIFEVIMMIVITCMGKDSMPATRYVRANWFGITKWENADFY